MYDSTFSVWFALLSRNASLHGSHLRPSERSAELLADLYSDGIPPDIAALKSADGGETAVWLSEPTLETVHVQKLKRGRGREAYNQVAA